MATQDVNLGAKAQQDKDAEIAKLRDELARAQAKRDNDERSAFGRLAAEAELRKQKEAEVAELQRKFAELQAKNAKTVLTPEQLEALGASGAEGVERLVEAKMAPFTAVQPLASDAVAPLTARLSALEEAMRLQSARQSYTQNLVSWAGANGSPDLFARLSPGGDLSDKWAAFAQQNPGAVQAFEGGDTETTKAYVKLFLYENPGLSQRTGTPPASGGFAPASDSNQYGPQNWMADTTTLDEGRASGRISHADWSKGYAEANAKLAASQGKR